MGIALSLGIMLFLASPCETNTLLVESLGFHEFSS